MNGTETALHAGFSWSSFRHGFRQLPPLFVSDLVRDATGTSRVESYLAAGFCAHHFRDTFLAVQYASAALGRDDSAEYPFSWLAELLLALCVRDTVVRRMPEARLEAVRQEAMERGDDPGAARALMALAWNANKGGDFVESRSLAESALEIMRGAGTRYEVSETLLDAGIIARRGGDSRASEVHLHEGQAIAQEIGNSSLYARFVGSLATIPLFEGDFASALVGLQEASQLAESTGEPLQQTLWMTRVGRAWVGVGEAEKGIPILKSALKLAVDRRMWLSAGEPFGYLEEYASRHDPELLAELERPRQLAREGLEADQRQVLEYIGTLRVSPKKPGTSGKFQP